MKKYTGIDGKAYWMEIFTGHGDPFILLATNENYSAGTSKIYFLQRYSIKFAQEDFCKYVVKVQELKNNQNQ